jgi:hypothetical protein
MCIFLKQFLDIKTPIVKSTSSYEKIPFVTYCKLLFLFPEMLETLQYENIADA